MENSHAPTPSSPRRGQRYAPWLLLIAGVLALGYASWPREPEGPGLRAAQSYAEKLAAAATSYREVTGDWPESLTDLPASAIRAANAIVPEEYRQASSGGECDEAGQCSPFRDVRGYRVMYYGFVWPGPRQPPETRTCAHASEPRLTVKSYHGQSHWWNWQRSMWQTRDYGELMPLDWSFAALNDSIAWAVGNRVYATTVDGGRTCRFGQVEEQPRRHLRAVAPVTPNIVYMLSAHDYGRPPGRIYKTTDGGSTWQSVLERNDLVFMTLGFWDAEHGLVLARDNVVEKNGNPGSHVSKPLLILTTRDGGRTWQQQTTPPVLRGESPKRRSLELVADRHAWFATYADVDSVSRMFRTADGGRTWSVVTTSAKPAVGIDLIAFRDTLNGVALGCAYVVNGLMRTTDGGKTWSVGRNERCQICSELTYVTTAGRPILVARVDDRIMHSRDDGRSWTAVESTLYRGIAPARPWRTWVEREGGWATRWAGRLPLVEAASRSWPERLASVVGAIR